MGLTLNQIGEKLAEASLDIGAIKLRPDKPFKWASGFFMPIYNDNRMLLGNYAHRMLVVDGFKALLEENGIRDLDFIAGTSTAGIAPAASLAQELGDKELTIIQDGQIYATNKISVPGEEFDFSFMDADLIASTSPWAIPQGVYLANAGKAAFAYVRQSAKQHGLNQQVEGIVAPGQNTFLIDFYRGESYFELATQALKDKGTAKIHRFSRDLSHAIIPSSVSGRRGVLIEDLISTGRSFETELQTYQQNGADMSAGCLAIFNYGLRESFTSSILTYDVLLKVAEKKGNIRGDQVAMLQEWREDPFNWGQNHGFPPEGKKK
ncbi:MAG: hypothetical protein Q8Q31_04935 [Nanoarchaeota archaeon]|nr:hypothetical protein [Nanoarchaeota archaeon]